MTPEEITAKCAELSATLNTKVEAITVFADDEKTDVAVAFLKNPSRAAKRAILDEMLRSNTAAGQLYLEAALIKDASDPCLSSSASEHDALVIGAELACLGKVEVWQSDLKKK